MVDKIFGGSLAEGRTGATTTLIVLGLCFILLLERGPGREHITIQSYMLAMVAGLGALYALVLAAGPVREFFELELLSAGQWFLSPDLGRDRLGARRRRMAAAVHPGARGASGAGGRRGGRARRADGSGASPASHSAGTSRRRGAPSVTMEAASDRNASVGRRTKIVATIGPATRSVETLTELIGAGADVFRLNFSHGTREEHAENVAMAREAAEAAGREVGLLGDLPGPKLRIDEVEGGMVQLEEGSELTLTTDEEVGAPDHLSVSWEGLPSAVEEGDEVYLADGTGAAAGHGADRPTRSAARSRSAGAVASHQGLNMPGTDVPLPSAGRSDLDWVDFAVQHGIDLIAVSFVRRAEDLSRSSGASGSRAPTSR